MNQAGDSQYRADVFAGPVGDCLPFSHEKLLVMLEVICNQLRSIRGQHQGARFFRAFQCHQPENHASIVYDPHSGLFMIVNGEGIKTYLNGEPVTEPKIIKDGDKIGIGSSTYDFVAYCREDRQWI